jgi:hypothetical protein
MRIFFAFFVLGCGSCGWKFLLLLLMLVLQEWCHSYQYFASFTNNFTQHLFLSLSMVESLTNEDVIRWLAAVTSTTAKCWVENPETVKESGFMTTKTYTTYRVLLKASDGELAACRHRFSDFETLRGMWIIEVCFVDWLIACCDVLCCVVLLLIHFLIPWLLHEKQCD